MEHINPVIIMSIEFLCNSWVFRHQHSFILLCFGLTYILVNFIGTQVKGEAIYDIITWDDISTLYFLIGILALLFAAFHTLTFLSIWRAGKEEGSVVLLNSQVKTGTDDVSSSLV